jgi:hypothetical protein
VDGKELGRTTHDDGDGWKAFELSTTGVADRTGDVEFRVEARGGGERQFCFQADVR